MTNPIEMAIEIVDRLLKPMKEPTPQNEDVSIIKYHELVEIREALKSIQAEGKAVDVDIEQQRKDAHLVLDVLFDDFIEKGLLGQQTQPQTDNTPGTPIEEAQPCPVSITLSREKLERAKCDNAAFAMIDPVETARIQGTYEAHNTLIDRILNGEFDA